VQNLCDPGLLKKRIPLLSKPVKVIIWVHREWHNYHLKEQTIMEHRVKVTVLDKKLFPELQAQYCAVPDSGKCPCYNVGDEFMFYRNDERDDYWHMGAGTLIQRGQPDDGVLRSPGTMHCGTDGVPFCSEAWDAISRYIYAALQGGAIMHGWMHDDKVMIACCNDGTRPVIFKIERIDIED
jgi:uncharacterized repeat protein (TIGR04076 family)